MAIGVIVGNTLFTNTVNEVFAVWPSRFVTVRVMVVVPLCPEAGVTVTVRAAPVPPRTILAVGTSVVLLEVPVTVSEVSGSSTSANTKANAPVEDPVGTVWFAMEEMVGGISTSKMKLVVAVLPPPSLTVRTMVVIPLFPLVGVIVTVRAAPEPPKTILAFNTRVVLLEVPVNVNEAAGVTASPTVNGSAAVAVLIAMS